MEMITIYNFGFSIGDKLVLSSEPSMHSVPLYQVNDLMLYRPLMINM